MEKTFTLSNNAFKKNNFFVKKISNFTKSYFNVFYKENVEKKDTQQNNVTDMEKLTIRQKEIIKLMAEGCKNKQIAEKLFISENTVKFHVKNIYAALQLKSRNDLYEKLGSLKSVY